GREHVAELAEDDIECGVVEGQLFHITLAEFDLDIGELCVFSGPLEQLRSEIQPADSRSRAGGRHCHDACATRHVQHVLAGDYTGILHQAGCGRRCECLNWREMRPSLFLRFFELGNWVHGCSKGPVVGELQLETEVGSAEQLNHFLQEIPALPAD